VSNHPGFFVVFEGGDGAGKSTQVKKLTQKLESLNQVEQNLVKKLEKYCLIKMNLK
jgi:thymidylate kinase